MSSDYTSAERFLHWNADRYCHNLEIDFRWIGGTDSFWYANQTKAGTEIRVVDAATGEQRAALDDEVASFEANTNVPQTVFIREGDLWLRSVRDQSERRLTHDAEARFAYGTAPGSGAGFRSFVGQDTTPQVPVVLWAPDASRFVTYRLDERGVRELHLLETAPRNGVRPVLHSYPYAFPGDANKPGAELLIVEVATGCMIKVKHDAVPVTMLDPIQDDRVWWGADSKNIYVIPREEGQQRVQLLMVDTATGSTRVLIEEHARTYVEIAGSAWGRAVRVLSNRQIIWYSEIGRAHV